MAVVQGSHVTISIPGGDTFKAVVLEVRDNEVVAQELGTQRAEIFPTHYIK